MTSDRDVRRVVRYRRYAIHCLDSVRPIVPDWKQVLPGRLSSLVAECNWYRLEDYGDVVEAGLLAREVQRATRAVVAAYCC